MSEIILSRRGFIGVISGVIATAATAALPASTPTRTKVVEVETYQCSALIPCEASLRDFQYCETTLKQKLRSSIRETGCRPLGKVIRSYRYLPHYDATLVVYAQDVYPWAKNPEMPQIGPRSTNEG